MSDIVAGVSKELSSSGTVVPNGGREGSEIPNAGPDAAQLKADAPRPDLHVRAGSPPRHHARGERYGEIKREVRNGARVQLRQAPNGDHEFEGMASTFDEFYTVEDWLGEYEEEFRFGAFTKPLADGADVPLLINHEGLPLARTSSGTLQLQQRPEGLWTSSILAAADPDVQRLVPKMDRGDLSQMSIAFRAFRQEWDEDYTRRSIIEAGLYDVSIVTTPANPGTSAMLRGAELVRALAGVEVEQLLVACRSAGEPGLRELALRGATILEQVTTLWVDDDDDTTCPSCGATDVPDGAAYCPSCGGAMGSSGTLAAAASMVGPDPLGSSEAGRAAEISLNRRYRKMELVAHR